MGVRGLQGFIKFNTGISRNIQFHSSTIIIDANNLLCCIYCNMVLERDGPQARCDIYGGDLVTYGELIKEFFVSLEKCNITPILVFDGSVIGKQSTQDQLVLKEKAIYKRGFERFQMARDMKEEAPDEKISMPQILNNVFKNIANDLGIQKIQSPYEADTHIARLANDLDCPVLTNDSDFLIYSLPKGFIMLDYFYYKNIISLDDKTNCINCIIYSQSRLSKFLPGLRRDALPLLSVLLGNDYVEAGTFDKVTETICNKPYNGPLVAQSWSHRRIANLLDWLKGKSVDEAIRQILDQLPSSRQASLERVIRLLLRNYKIEEADNFETELSAIYPTSNANPEHNIHIELLPPAYLRRLFETGDLCPTSLDIVFHNTHYNYPIIDDFTLPSSSLVKYRPYSLAVTLLRPTSYEGLSTYRRQIMAEKDAFQIYDRLRGEYTKLIVRPLESLEQFGSLEHLNLYSTITLQPELKKNLLMEIFRFNAEELNLMTDLLTRIFKGRYIQESCACLLLVKYIGLETKLPPKPQFVDALLLTFFYYAALKGHLNPDTTTDEQYGRILLALRPHSIKNNGRQYERSSKLYRRIVHFISQLQAAYKAYGLLNSILNNVFQVPRFESFMNGTLIFRLTKMLRSGEMNMETICQNITALLDASGSVKVMVLCDE